MAKSIINADDGSVSGVPGIKTSGGDENSLVIQSVGSDVVEFNGTGLDLLAGNIKINGSSVLSGDSFTIPSGSTAERPASPVAGDLRFNTDLNLLEQYDGTEWSVVGKTDQAVRDLFSAAGDLTYNSSTGVFSVTTATVPDILKPDVLSPIDGEGAIGETPTIKTGGYYSLFGIEQASAQFQVATDSSFTNIVYDSGVISAVTEHQVPAGNLSEGTTYYIRVEFTDTSNNSSGFSDPSEFQTGSFTDFDSLSIGTATDGGFYAGKVVSDVDGNTYAIVVSDGDGDTDRTGAGEKNWGLSDDVPQAETLADGKSVTDFIINNKNLSDYPAFEWVKTNLNDANYNGYSDWYIPARDELELLYRYFKPTTVSNDTGSRITSGFGADGEPYGTNNSSIPNGSGYTTSDPSQTSVSSFQLNSTDYISDRTYISSTQINNGSVWGQNFDDGEQSSEGMVFSKHVRSVRRVQIA